MHFTLLPSGEMAMGKWSPGLVLLLALLYGVRGTNGKYQATPQAAV
jgi:hypothetical protein